MNATRLLPVYSTAFTVLYALAVACELPSLLYYPAPGVFAWTPLRSAAAGPPIVWYGWIAFAAVGAGAFTLLACVLPRSWDRWVWPLLSSATPPLAALLIVWLLREWFL